MDINEIKFGTKFICPDSEIDDYIIVSMEESFWIDAQNVWNLSCYVCGGSHNIGDYKNANK